MGDMSAHERLYIVKTKDCVCARARGRERKVKKGGIEQQSIL